MAERSSPRVMPPWRLADMLLLYVFTAIGFTILLVAWWGVSGTARLSHQVPWVSLAGAGVIVLGTGNSFWLLIGRRAVADRRRQLLTAFEAAAPLPEGAQPNGSGPQPVWSAGMQHYHRASCQLVQGKATSSDSLAAHRGAGRRPCGMCLP